MSTLLSRDVRQLFSEIELTSNLTYAEYVSRDALGLSELVRTRQITADELLDCALTRCEAVNGQINAVVLDHREHARKQIREGLPEGQLAGVPFLLKDLFVELRGTTTANGSVALRHQMASRNSTVTQRYLDAGLVIFGKTHSPEFGAAPSGDSTLWGAARNPWKLERGPGGSSGGAAAAVAAGIVPVANASDAGGSIRIPAAACGLFGLKPTRGRVPLGPARYEGAGGLATLHAVTRSVRDSAALLDAVAGEEPGGLYAAPAQSRPFLEEASREPGRLRIAMMPHAMHGRKSDRPCIDAIHDAAALCASLGHDLDEVKGAVDHELYFHSRDVLRAAGTTARVKGLERQFGRALREDELERATWRFHEIGLQITGDQVMAAREAMFVLHQQYLGLMDGFDLLLTPTMERLPAFVGEVALSLDDDDVLFGEAHRFTNLTAPLNMTGQPAMSVPLFWTAEGVPVGVQFVGRFNDEPKLFRLAAQLERARPWFNRLPRLSETA